MVANDPSDWGKSEAPVGGGRFESASTPVLQEVRVAFGRSNFAAAGHSPTVQAMGARYGLHQLLGLLILAVLSGVSLGLSVYVVVNAPDSRAAFIPWIAIPNAVLAFGLAGFATFHVIAPGGWRIGAGPAQAPRKRAKSQT